MRKTEDLTLLTDSEISQRLQKTLQKVQMVFISLVLFSVVAAVFGFSLNANGHQEVGSAVSFSSALVVIAGAFYLRHLRKDNDSLIAISKSRQVIQ